jgi:1-aminocyclopropane-1-carboxylate deaminase
MFLDTPKSNIQEVIYSEILEKEVTLCIKRDDKLHPFVSGNKFRKLKYNIKQAQNLGYKTLVTFGGAYSNHIAATAYAGYANDFKTIGVIRGDELEFNTNAVTNNPTLQFAQDHNMKLEFVSRSLYKLKNTPKFIEALTDKFGDFYLVPEGGTNDLAVQGCQEILDLNTSHFNFFTCAVGTGGTISGIINAALENQKVIGFPALKGNFLEEEIKKYATKGNNWWLNTNYNFGGYAKFSEELINFINKFSLETGIPLDAVYTGKMMFGLVDLIKNDYFKPGTAILAIHTGGLQGNAGINQKLKRKNWPLLN